ncbi:MAG: hypothetical protein HYZ53_31115 [Planctomycetes bacterium]|nr:hypothetical protein [Planctomycetota bacterium]
MLLRALNRFRKAMNARLRPDLAYALGSPLRPAAECPGAREARGAALRWLFRLQDATGTGGVASGVNLLHYAERGDVRRAVGGAYPETTGYILPTILACAARGEADDGRERARRMADWLLTVQLPDGGFPGSQVGAAPQPPVVFNTCQIVLGLWSAFRAFGDEAYRAAAVRACKWVASVQEPDGSFASYASMPRNAHHARAAWPLLLVGRAAGEPAAVDAARRFMRRLLDRRRPGGWLPEYAHPGHPGAYPHHICYALRGCLECRALFAGVEDGLARELEEFVLEGVAALLRHVDPEGRMPGAFGDDFAATGEFDCLTGNAQLAGLVYRLAAAGLPELPGGLDAAGRLTRFVRRTQLARPDEPLLDGAVAGAYPVDGDYHGLTLVSWGAKFLIDALLLEEAHARGMAGEGDVGGVAEELAC